jgi:hypothetical protein
MNNDFSGSVKAVPDTEHSEVLITEHHQQESKVLA